MWLCTFINRQHREATMQKNDLIEQDLELNRVSMTWIRFWSKLNAAIAVIVIVGFIYWIYNYAQVYPIDLVCFAGLLVTATVTALAHQAYAGYSQIKLWQRHYAIDLIRLDIRDAVQFFLRNEFAGVLPKANNLRTQVDLGEELHKEVRLVTERYARLQANLSATAGDRTLALAIHELVRAALQAEGAAASNQDVINFLERLHPNPINR